jgi:hypothetical protein
MSKFFSIAKNVIKWGAVVMACIKAVEVLIEELEKINPKKQTETDGSIEN